MVRILKFRLRAWQEKFEIQCNAELGFWSADRLHFDQHLIGNTYGYPISDTILSPKQFHLKIYVNKNFKPNQIAQFVVKN
jgi:hypothetical protein